MINILGQSIIGFLEHEILKHEPQIQEFLLSELEAVAKMIMEWISDKMMSDIDKHGG